MNKILTREEAEHCINLASVCGVAPVCCVVTVRFLRDANRQVTVTEHIAPLITVRHSLCYDTHSVSVQPQEQYKDWEDFAQAYGLTSGHTTSTPT